MGLHLFPEQDSPVPSSSILRIAALALAAVFAQTVVAPAVYAHAVIIESSPAVNAVLPAGDADLTLRFNSRIDHQRSRLTLIAADGAMTPVAIAPNSAPDIVAAKMPGLAPGQYRLRWQVLAIDGHLTRGDIPFSVKAP